MIKRLVLAGALACALASIARVEAQAQSYPQVAGPGGSVVAPHAVTAFPLSNASLATSPVTSVGTGSTQIDGQVARRSYLLLYNPSALGGTSLYCTVNGAAPVANAGGALGIAPGQYLTFENSAVPNGPINCIAPATTPITAIVLDQ